VRVLAPWASRGAVLRAVTLAGRDLPARVQVFRDHVRSVLTLCAPRDGDTHSSDEYNQDL
jgi:hypothetical protein